MQREDEVEETDEQVVLEEYKIWKKHCPFLYDTVVTHVLEWPSQTIEWCPGRECSPNSDYSIQTLILGTNTGNSEQDLLLQGKVKVPMEQSLISGKIYLDNTKDVGGMGLLSKTDNKIEISARINHDREVLKARIMPKQDNIIATKSPNGVVYVYDMKKYTNKSSMTANLSLAGHSKEGKALGWAVHRDGFLASGALDGVLNVYDVAANNSVPFTSYTAHESGVEEVSWNENGILASVGRDKKIMLWDLRQELPTLSVEASSRELITADFCPSHSELLATGGKDKTIGIWDIRNFSSKLATLTSHKEAISSLKWEPSGGTLLASASWDRRVMIWDISLLGKSISPEEAEDGPPELVFIHGGHTSIVSDVAWNPNENLTLASVAEDNILQVWQMSNSIFNY